MESKSSAFGALTIAIGCAESNKNAEANIAKAEQNKPDGLFADENVVCGPKIAEAKCADADILFADENVVCGPRISEAKCAEAEKDRFKAKRAENTERQKAGARTKNTTKDTEANIAKAAAEVECKTNTVAEVFRADAIVFTATYRQSRCQAVESEKPAAELMRDFVVGFSALSTADRSTIRAAM